MIMKVGLFLVCIVFVLLFSSCAPSVVSPFNSRVDLDNFCLIHYYYDSTHEVGIWHVKNGYGESLFVLPASQFKNPEKMTVLEPLRNR